jgi:hypothetical protein
VGEALRSEMTALAERLAAEERLLERLEITKNTVIEVLADDDPTGEQGRCGPGRATTHRTCGMRQPDSKSVG